MAKPLIIIKWPAKDFEDGALEPEMSWDKTVENMQSRFGDALNDYHFLIIETFGIKNPQFQGFFEKDFDQVKYDELKQIVIDAAKNRRKKAKTVEY